MDKRESDFEGLKSARATRHEDRMRAYASLFTPTPEAWARLCKLLGSDQPFYVVEDRSDSAVVDFGAGHQGLTPARARVLAEFLLRKVQSGCAAVRCAGGRLRGVITSNLT